MPGKRMIDENICVDKRLNSVSDGAENLFYRLLTKTDDIGNVFADPDIIRGQIYPRRLNNITIETIQERLKELHNAKDEDGLGLIDIYISNGEFYAYFPNFLKHQKLRTDYRPKIVYPLRTRSNSLRDVSNPFDSDVQVKLSKASKQASKQAGTDSIELKDQLKELLNIYTIPRDILTVKSILKHMEFNDSEIDKALEKFVDGLPK